MRWWIALRAALAGAAVTLVLLLIAAGAVVYFGWFDVAASSEHLAPVRLVVHRVMMRSVGARAGAYAPARVPVSVAAAGFCMYRKHCETCHGGPGTDRGEWADGLNPPPPYLIDSRTRWSPSELHWIVSNGVKMTAMPAWKASMNDKQIWSIVAFLKTMPDVPAAAYRRWASAGICPTGADFAAAIGTVPAAPNVRQFPRSWPSEPGSAVEPEPTQR